jgi:hypothetical protein
VKPTSWFANHTDVTSTNASRRDNVSAAAAAKAANGVAQARPKLKATLADISRPNQTKGRQQADAASRFTWRIAFLLVVTVCNFYP